MSFSAEEDEKIIDFVRNHECFYNVKSKDYKNSQLKKRLWCEIATEINKTDVECSKRWVYLRDYYIRKRGKPGSGSCSKQAKKRSDLLSFLDNVSTSKRRTLTNVESETNSGVNSDAFEEETVGTTQRTDQSGDEEEEQHEQNRDTPPQIPTPPPSRKRKNSNSDERLELLKQIAGRNSNHDEIDYFFLSVAKAVKKLPKISQTKIRMEVSQLLGREELAMLASREENVDT